MGILASLLVKLKRAYRRCCLVLAMCVSRALLLVEVFYRRFGALTNKPYAFSFRAWEVESVRTRQPLDPWLEEVQVDVRGTAVLRTLPVRKGPAELSWLPDYVRFAHDGLQYQRQTSPALYLPRGFVAAGFEKESLGIFESPNVVSWDLVLSFLHHLGATSRQESQRRQIEAVLGFSIDDGPERASILPPIYFPSPFADLSDREALLRWGVAAGETLRYESEACFYPDDAPRPWDVPSLAALLRAPWSSALLVGVDARRDYPKLYLLLRHCRRVALRPFPVFSIGPAPQRGLSAMCLGSGFSVLAEALTNEEDELFRFWSKRFTNDPSQRHLVLVDAAEWSTRAGTECLQPAVRERLETVAGVDIYPLFPHVGWVADLFLGAGTSLHSSFALLSAERSPRPVRPCFVEGGDCIVFPGQAVVYLTAYAPSALGEVELPTFVLPAPAPFLERGGVYVSHDGDIVQTLRVLNPPVDSRGVAQCRSTAEVFRLLTQMLTGQGTPIPAHPLAWCWSPFGRVRRVRSYRPAPGRDRAFVGKVRISLDVLKGARVQQSRPGSVYQPNEVFKHSLILSLAAARERKNETAYYRRI